MGVQAIATNKCLAIGDTIDCSNKTDIIAIAEMVVIVLYCHILSIISGSNLSKMTLKHELLYFKLPTTQLAVPQLRRINS
jgi:hypothetical protein